MTVIGRAIIEEVIGTETAVQRGTEAGEEMTAMNDTVVGEETTTTTDALDTMMTDEVGTVDGETRKGEEASEMTEAGTVVEVVAVEAGEGASVKGLARQSGDHQLPKALCPCRKENAKHLAGMSMPQVTSNIPPCKRSKQVRHIRLLPKLVVLRNVFIQGMFNLPGANRTQIPPILGIPGLPPPMPVQTFGMGIGVNPNLSRQSRRLYIGSITPDITEQNLADFFNSKMIEMSIGTGGPGNPVLAVQCNYEKNYAFVEVRLHSFHDMNTQY